LEHLHFIYLNASASSFVMFFRSFGSKVTNF